MKESESKILDKIRKLLQVTKDNGATEGEVENALKMAQRLIIRHDIDEQELIISPLDIKITQVENQFKSNEPKYWFWDLLETISKCYSCRVTKSKKQGIHVYKIIGFDNDRAVVKEIFETILPVIRNLTSIRYKEYCVNIKDNSPWSEMNYTIKELIKYHILVSKKVFTTSYINGFLLGLSDKLEKDRNQFLQIESERKAYDLIIVKKDDLIEEFVKEELKPKAVSPRKMISFSQEAYDLGLEDGTEENTKKQLH
jgi:hypothetical protein